VTLCRCRHESLTDTSLRLSIALTHLEYADAVGTSREQVTRLMREFETKGLISRVNGWIVLPPTSRLWSQARASGLQSSEM
jgi:CRP-like cAMP-binding protein